MSHFISYWINCYTPASDQKYAKTRIHCGLMSCEAHTLCFLSNTNLFQSFLWIIPCLCKRIFWTVIEKLPPAGFSLYKFIGFGGWIAGQARPFDVHHFYKDIKCPLQLPSRKCSLFPQKNILLLELHQPKSSVYYALDENENTQRPRITK